MHHYFAFGPERHVAFRFALLVRTQVVRFREVDFQRIVVLIMPVLLKVPTQIARKVELMQVLFKYLNVVKELLAEITPRMRQNFRASFGSNVSIFNVRSEFSHVIDPLLPDKDASAL